MRSVFDTAADRDLVVREYDAVEGGKQTLSRLAAHIAGDFLVSRQVDAPRERVWKCWTEPERLAASFGPKGFETITAQLDFRPGGVCHYCMRGNGVDMWGTWTFNEIDAPGKLVFVNAFSDKDGGLGRMSIPDTLDDYHIEDADVRACIAYGADRKQRGAPRLATFGRAGRRHRRAIRDYAAATFRGRPPLRPFSLELRAFARLVRRPSSAPTPKRRTRRPVEPDSTRMTATSAGVVGTSNPRATIVVR